MPATPILPSLTLLPDLRSCVNSLEAPQRGLDEEIMSMEGSHEYVARLSSFISFASQIFAPESLSMIESYYNQLERTSDYYSLLSRATNGRLAQSLVSRTFEPVYSVRSKQGTQLEDESTSVGTGRSSASGAGPFNPGQGGRGGSGGGRRGSSRRGGAGGGGGRRGGLEFSQTPFVVRPRGATFRSVGSVQVGADLFTTPPKLRRSQLSNQQGPSRNVVVRGNSLVFKEATFNLASLADTLQPTNVDTILSIPPYDSNEVDVTPGTTRLLFHGTRSSNVPLFRAMGVEPFFEPNECSPGNAFYCSNDLPNAYAHPLFVHPRPGPTPDHIAVFVFAVDAWIINGEGSPPQVGRCEWFPDEDEFLQFAADNMHVTSAQAALRNHAVSEPTFVVAPPCIPDWESGSPLPRILRGYTATGIDLAQVAFCNAKAWDYISECVVLILEESRS
ncbi:hypothetical protein P7C70_g6047, partial [Phenoliferia sp. Uapishka_3]